tara:strand:+ start:508 stop:816 length:309 start_codon:yes stop_codon:yes gene_type:complete
MSIAEILESSLTEKLKPSFLDILNESNLHNVPIGSESHFRILIVSDRFENLNVVKRHKMVYQVCKIAIKSGIHALAMQCFTEEEWKLNPKKNESPTCLGGST